MVEWWTEVGFPVYISVAAYLGAQNPKADSKKEAGDLNELLKMAGPGGMIN